jgi:hypothetical protein
MYVLRVTSESSDQSLLKLVIPAFTLFILEYQSCIFLGTSNTLQDPAVVFYHLCGLAHS